MRLVDCFPQFGPNRRSEFPVVEALIEFEDQELAFLDEQGLDAENKVFEMLRTMGVVSQADASPKQAASKSPMGRIAAVYAFVTLLLQRQAGHKVGFSSVKEYPDKKQCRCLIEHEHCDVGMTAAHLALQIVTRQLKNTSQALQQFRDFAQSRLLPPDTQAIIDAAFRRGIPYLKLDRHPFGPGYFDHLTGKPRSRPNGLLMLGHSCHQRFLEGTYCLQETDTARALPEDGKRIEQLLEQMQIPGLSKERKNKGDSYRIIIANDKVVGVVEAKPDVPGFTEFAGTIHSTLSESALAMYRAVKTAVIVITVNTPDVTQSLEQSGGALASVELAPVLHEFLPAGSSLMKYTAEQIVAWCFPPEAPSRIPIVAVTGTNGKTTCCRMINHIMISAGLAPGLVCSDGRYINNKMDKPGDGCSRTGHVQLLTNKKINAAVLEAHYAGLYLRGFAFHWCDVAICLNVTQEHIQQKQNESVHQLAAIKRALLERARYAAVLNADDEHCLGMVPFLSAKNIVLVSMQADAKDLADRVPRETSQCVLEEISDEDWIVIYKGAKKIPVISVASIPACFGGMAEHNISNAMHAISACYFLGLNLADINKAMGSFQMDFDSNPGRLNIHDTGTFRVILDYASNPDAFSKLCAYVDQQQVTGRKILLFAVPGNMLDEGARAVAKVAAGHFDHYICRRFLELRGRKEHEITNLLQTGLLEAGISNEQITVADEPAEGISQTLQMGKAGDLLVLISSSKEKYGAWEQITSY